jgi:hypothetical protein
VLSARHILVISAVAPKAHMAQTVQQAVSHAVPTTP